MLDQFSLQIRYLRKAKRATLRVTSPFQLKVTAPYFTTKREIHSFITQNIDWVLEHNSLLLSRPQPQPTRFEDGCLLPFKGRLLRISICRGARRVDLVEDELKVFFNRAPSESEVRAGVVRWYKDQALAYVSEHIPGFANQLGVRPRSVRVRSYRARWGGCSAKGDLVFNWQIIAMEESLIRYVIAHELCHLIEMNHGRSFYSHLQRLGFVEKNYKKQFRNLRNPIL